MLGNLLVELSWLAEAEEGFLLLSGQVLGERFLPRDARQEHLERTSLPLLDLQEALPPHLGLILDAPAAPELCKERSWCLCAGQAPELGQRFSDQGPSRFLRSLLRGLSGQAAAPEGLNLEALLLYLERDSAKSQAGEAQPWSYGAQELQLLPPLEQLQRCRSCQQDLDDLSATFCPSCGAALQLLESLDGGRYTLLCLIGEGGMGQVYLAEDNRLKAKRALKLLSLPSGLSPEERDSFRGRMIQEARATQTLNGLSHHIVQIFDVGYSPERGEPFLVMELLEGETLGARLKRGALSLEETLTLAKSIAEALKPAHDRGMIHRDLKPDNIMLVQHAGRDNFVKLLDFGLVKMEQAEVKTHSGQLMGTLQYMPPEQLRGEAVDPRADLFSFGAILYECLSGERANPGRSQAEIFGVLLSQGIQALELHCPQLPPELSEMINRCLRLEREERPADIQEILSLLQALQADSLSCEPPSFSSAKNFSLSPSPQDKKPLRGSSALWVLGLLVPLLLLFWWQGREAPRLALKAELGSLQEPLPKDLSVLPTDLGFKQLPLPPDLGILRLPKSPPGDPKKARVESDEQELRWVDGILEDRLAAAVVTLLLTEDPSKPHSKRDLERWSRSPKALQRWWLQKLPLNSLRGEDPLRFPLESLKAWKEKRPQSLKLRGLGRLLLPQTGPILLEHLRCGSAQALDQLLSVRWRVPGYRGGRCEGRRCATLLVQALQKARKVAEQLNLKLRLLRGRGDDARSLDTHCALSP